MGLDLGHRQALLALCAAQVTPGHQIPGREKASQAPFLIRPSSPLNAKLQQKTSLKGGLLLERVMGLPPALGQCRGQPGELKNHSPDGFLPACGRAVPFESHYPYEQHK